MVTTSTPSRFVSTVLDAMKHLECRRIKSAEDYDAVFRLRYKAYTAENLIDSNGNSKSIDNYDLLENCQIFGLFIDGRLISSLRTHTVNIDTPWCPTMKYFEKYLMPKVDEGESFLDASRFCADPDIASEHPSITYLTVRVAYMASIFFNTTYNISVIRPSHAAFYKRYYGFERWAGGVMLDWFKEPVELYVGDMAVNRPVIDGRLPFMQSNFEERLMLFSDSLAQQGIKSVTGLHGNRSTNSVPSVPGPESIEKIMRAS
jgi:hypothetical protein